MQRSSSITIRDLAPGARFILCRTGERFRLTGKPIMHSKCRYIVVSERDGRETDLNYQCVVRPLIKPRIRIKAA